MRLDKVHNEIKDVALMPQPNPEVDLSSRGRMNGATVLSGAGLAVDHLIGFKSRGGRRAARGKIVSLPHILALPSGVVVTLLRPLQPEGSSGEGPESVQGLPSPLPLLYFS